jgi:hypothetical protein
VTEVPRPRTVWRKSRASGTSSCLEVAIMEECVLIRDSKDRLGPRLRFTPQEWTAFLTGVRSGEFDLPSAD